MSIFYSKHFIAPIKKISFLSHKIEFHSLRKCFLTQTTNSKTFFSYAKVAKLLFLIEL